MATDWQDYAEHMIKVMESNEGFKNTAGNKQFASADGLRPRTRFEQRGLKLGHDVWDLVYIKTG